MPFEMTQMRAYLKDYMQRIKDVLTTEEDIARYEQFNEKLRRLSDLTTMHYNSRIPFTQEHRIAFRRTYEEALEAAGAVMAQEAGGAVALQMRSVVREMIPLLQTDLHGMELIEREPDLAKRSLPELIGRVRTQAVDLGNRPIPAGNGPMPLRVEFPDRTETGVFVPAGSEVPGSPSVAYARFAGLLGQPELVTPARSVLLTHAGGSTVGTFQSRGDGVDPAAISPVDPIQFFGPDNLDTAAAVSGLASMQLMDYLFGTAERGPENCCLRFNPAYGKEARLVGLTAKAGGVALGDGAGDEARLAGLGAIPESLYLQLCDANFGARLRLALQDCQLPEGTLERILARRDALMQKVERDAAYFDNKPLGYVEQGRVRLVADHEWAQYRAANLAAVNAQGYFAKLLELPGTLRERVKNQPAPQEQVLGTPVGKLVGDGLHQEPDPLNAARPETVKLHIPTLDENSALKGNLNARYPVRWTENGRPRQGMFTLPQVVSKSAVLRNLTAPYLENPAYRKYQDLLLAIRDYYALENDGKDFPDFPDKASKFPWKEMGLTQERFRELARDAEANQLVHDIHVGYLKSYVVMQDEYNRGTSYGQRMELRNVAMSEVADELGVPNLLARSTTAQVELDGKIVEGVFMESADGVDFRKADPGTAMASISAEQAKTVYNTEGLKDLADMQILDYLCMNTDRHSGNMFYRFEGLETGHPRFLGVQGIDNDLSFGTKVPKADKKEGFLPALQDIRVISEGMAAALQRPGLMEAIAAKMRKNGLSEQEVDAARQRLEQLQNRLRKGKMRVVRNGQWGRGENTIEQLAEGRKDSSVFQHFQEKVIDVMARQAAQSGRAPGSYVPMKETEYQKVQRVEAFGKTALRAEEQKELEQKAAERFVRQAEESTRSKLQVANPEHRALFELHRKLGELMADLELGSLPWPWGSPQYRQMHKACKNLQQYTGKLAQKLQADPDREISEQESETLRQQLNELSNRSTAYADYKRNDLTANNPGYFTPSRQSAAASCAAAAAAAVSGLDKARQAREKPMELVHESLRQAQADLSGKTGKALREQTARVLCLNGLTRMGLSRKTGMGVRKALQEQSLQRQMQRFMEEPAFQKLAALPDDELRALAAGKGGRALGDRFIRELARQPQAAPPAAREPRQPERGLEAAPPPAEAQPNGPGFHP